MCLARFVNVTCEIISQASLNPNYSKTKQLSGSVSCLLFSLSWRIDVQPAVSPAHRKGFSAVYCCFPCCSCCCGGQSCYEVLELETESPLWPDSDIEVFSRIFWSIFVYVWEIQCSRHKTAPISLSLCYQLRLQRNRKRERREKGKCREEIMFGRTSLEQSGTILKDECYIWIKKRLGERRRIWSLFYCLKDKYDEWREGILKWKWRLSSPQSHSMISMMSGDVCECQKERIW